ncbi:MAG: Vitamin B12 dependent methionine synthase activation subunit [Ruminococcaceae bacterium]|nr:Vitamin B12 dependent methionine synthase activation subunit [Oscillospiraceae bacterium]
MNSVILNKTFTEPPFCEKEILRYAGCKEADGEITALLKSCINEIKTELTYRVCYRLFDVKIRDDICDFGAFTLRSKDLSFDLSGCKSAILFAATVGVGIDRLIAKYGRISPSKALMFQAIGAERIEALCDAFCADISKEYNIGTKPRFSPGYGDLPLAAQKDMFAVLSPEKQIGLTLTDSLLMSPSKSVTAIVGLGGKKENTITNKCAFCDNKDCTFRGV